MWYNVYREDMYCEMDDSAYTVLHERLRRAWSIASCSPSVRPYRHQGDAHGQCFVTAMAVREAFGGDVYELHPADGAVHYYNVIGGRIADLSSEQFDIAIDKISTGTESGQILNKSR